MSVLPQNAPVLEPRLRLAPRVARPPSLFPSWRELLDVRGPWLVPLALLLVTRVVLARLLPFASEDAYITYRYSRNLALGMGAVFNPGERVMGFTSPLWMAWNAFGWLLTRDPVTWSRASAIAADALTLVLAATLLKRHVSVAAAWCFAFAFATWTAFTGVAISGMENGVLVALLVLAAAAVDAEHGVTGPALAALALIRPEGILCALIVAWRARGRDRLIAAALALPVFVALALYYGSPLPHSVAAKASTYGMPGPWLGRHWWEWAMPFAMGRWPAMPDGRFAFLLTVIAAPAAFAGAREWWRLRRTGLFVAIAACLAVWLGYALSGVPYFFWYLVVPLAGWFLLAAMGLPRIVRGAPVYVSAALLMLGCWTVVWELYAARARAEHDFAAVADYLVANSRPWEKVLLEPIGIIGWRAKLVVLDEVGLVSPAIAHRRAQGPGWMADLLQSERPRWLVARRAELTGGAGFGGTAAPFRNTAERDAALADYRERTVVDPGAGDASLVVLGRLDAPR